MKKIIYILLPFFLFSCGNQSVVQNSSSYTVSFEWSGKTITLNPNETSSINYNYIKVNNLQPDKRVMQTWNDGNNILITDLPSYNVYVENKTSEILTLKAEGWLENEMTNIIIGDFIDDDSQKGKLYTMTPKFSTEGNFFPVVIDHRFTNNICYVKIY